MALQAYRAPFHQDVIHIGEQEPEDKRPRTRCGYLVPDAFSNYEKSLSEASAISSGRALHFAADLICSGGLDIWIRAAYGYSIQHINVANPRIFVYLKQRVSELDKKNNTLPQEAFYSNPDVQAIISETVLILQGCPKRAKPVWPKVDENTKRPGWIRGVASSPETRATKAVWTSDSDSGTMYLVSNEFCRAIEEGSTEKALFWARWLLEEDSRVRKETKLGLSRKERGPATQNEKARQDVGYFLADVLAEIYNDLASKQLIRMHEEFIEIRRLFYLGEPRMASRFRRDCLAIMVLICTEVPRWKVPAATQLVKDPIRLSRAVGQGSSFFKEVLAYKSLTPDKLLKPTMTKGEKVKKAKAMTEKEKKQMSTEEQFDAYDLIMEAYLNK